MAKGKLGFIEGVKELRHVQGHWAFDEDDWALIAMLQDPIFCAELLFEDPLNKEYGGCYKVRDYQYPLFRTTTNYEIFPCARSVGKALAVDEPILTPSGWREIGALRVGDWVVGADGRPTEVIGVYPQGERDLYDVEFVDGTAIRADADHIWAVTCDSWKGHAQRVKDRTTKQIADSAMRYKVPLCRPVEFDVDSDLPIDPWLMGMMLGDGAFSSKTVLKFSSADEATVARMRTSLANVGCALNLEKGKSIDFYISGPALIRQFRKWGIVTPIHCRHLFIPPEYLWAPIGDRLELLRGLLDSDGTLTGVGGFEFSVTSPRLAADFRQLVLSLGGRARVRIGKAGYRDASGYKECFDRHRVTGQLPITICPFWQREKVEEWRRRIVRRSVDTFWRGIRSIAPAGRGEAVCIKVAAADGLFLARDFVITHNTESLKAKSVSTTFRRIGESLLLTAPELIHLQPLTQAVEERITSTRLTKEFLRKDGQRTGIVRSPAFEVAFQDGTKILGRIPHRTGRGVKGQHVPDLFVDECFPAGTLILTERGQVPIEQVRTGDSVLTHKGRWRPVTATMKRRRETVIVHGQGHPGLRCSSNHPFWCVTTRRAKAATDGHQGRIFSEPSFIPAIDLAPEGGYPSDNKGRYGARYWATPRRIAGVPTPRMPLGVKSECDSFWWLMGVYMAEGCVSKTGQLVFSIHRKEVEELTAVLDEVGIEWSSYPDREGLGARVGVRGDAGKAYSDFVRDEVGRVAAEHQVPIWVYGLPEKCRRLVLDGYVWGDGNPHADKRYAKGRWQASSRDKALALSIKLLAQTVGYSVTLYWSPGKESTIRGRTVKNAGCYGILGSTRSHTIEDDQHRFAQVKRVERTGESGELYDLTVADDHSFVAEGIVCSNSSDYPDRGYVEVQEVVEKDHVDATGEYDFTYHLYGVHAGGQGGIFGELCKGKLFKLTTITALMRPGWNKREKEAAAEMYGGTQSPDYRRNILGERGTGVSQVFVTSRLVACTDTDQESQYNQVEYVAQKLEAETVPQLIAAGEDVGKLLDLPDGLGQQVYAGMDVGLVTDPTVLVIAAVVTVNKRPRLKIVRKIHLWRFTPKMIRRCAYAIGLRYGKTLRGFGQDITGLGLPLFQEMDDDEHCPDTLKEVSRGYVFNAKLPVAVSEEYTSKQNGEIIDQYGNICKLERDPYTGQERLVTYMTMIEASTRYLRQFVDSGFLLIPFDNDLLTDMQGETEQRVKAMGNANLRKKPNAFHELDALRTLAMAYKAAEVEQMVYQGAPKAVLDIAVDIGAQQPVVSGLVRGDFPDEMWAGMSR